MRFLLALLLALSACVSVPKAVNSVQNKRTDKQTEFLDACWPESGPVSLDTECDDKRPVQWNHFPLKVKSIGSVEQTLSVIDFWNMSLGKEVFSYSVNEYTADIGILRLPQLNRNLNGMIDYYVIEGEPFCLVSMYIDSEETMAHELGHCLGLSHDPQSERSIMFPYSSERVLPYVEEADVVALKRRYKALR